MASLASGEDSLSLFSSSSQRGVEFFSNGRMAEASLSSSSQLDRQDIPQVTSAMSHHSSTDAIEIEGSGQVLPFVYNFSKSTEENYEAQSAEDASFTGDFVEHRKSLDYGYHRHYGQQRQLQQDDIVRQFLKTVVRDANTNLFCERPVHPWAVFTAGAMGAGKSRALSWLDERGLFPLPSFVQVDPDVIRRILPEMPGYLERNAESAGSFTQKEAGFVQELLTLEGLSRGKNVLVDGSLRNATWNKMFFARIRRDHPSVKLAIFHVVAHPAEVVRRAQKRAKETGRVVPQKVLERAMEQVPRAVAELSPLVDYHVRINTDQASPVIEAVPTPRFADPSWEAFGRQWEQSCAVDESVASPFMLRDFSEARSSSEVLSDHSADRAEVCVPLLREFNNGGAAAGGDDTDHGASARERYLWVAESAGVGGCERQAGFSASAATSTAAAAMQEEALALVADQGRRLQPIEQSE